MQTNTRSDNQINREKVDNAVMNAKPDNSTSRYADERPQIDIESTFDADIVLRKIIEDRASILALQGRAAANETELMKAR